MLTTPTHGLGAQSSSPQGIDSIIANIANRSIVQNVNIVSSIVTTAQLASLLQSVVTVMGSFTVGPVPLVTDVSAPLLQSVAADFTIQTSPNLASVTFVNLTTANGSFTMSGLNALTGSAISDGFPVLATVTANMRLQGFSLAGADARTPLVFFSLGTVGSLTIQQTLITAVSMPTLTTVSGALTLNILNVVSASRPSYQLSCKHYFCTPDSQSFAAHSK